jgi:hypothetical protein
MMADKGLSASDIADIAEANEPERSSAAIRQKRYRDNKRNERNVTRDVTPVSLKEDQNPSGTTLPDEAIASSPARQPLTEAVEAWNESAAACGWPTIRSLSANRAKLLSARLREHGISGWKDAILKARSSPYLAGRDPPSWFTFPWLIKAENFLKLTEGNYDRRHAANSDPTLAALAEYQSLIGGGGAVG